MANKTGISLKVADILSLQPMCEAPDVEGLTPEQTAAVHLFKHEVLAAAYRLYVNVPAEMVDPLLVRYLEKLSAAAARGRPVRRA
jgi:hypothetical protein